MVILTLVVVVYLLHIIIDDNDDMINVFIQYMDMPNTTNPCTYSVGVSASWGGGTRDLYINDRE